MEITRILSIIAYVLATHILVKPFVFLLPYRQRRAILDNGYGEHASAPGMKTQDRIVLIVSILIALVSLTAAPAIDRGYEQLILGLWLGATWTQLFFHRFNAPLSAVTQDRLPDAARVDRSNGMSALKHMSYAIQAEPSRGVLELGLLMATTACALWKL